jgi:hypothetical protein
MKNKDIECVKSLLKITEEDACTEPYFDPVTQIQDALAGFLQSRLKKLQEDSSFEILIRESLAARITEASFSDLMRLLDIFQVNSNSSVSQILSPFIAKAGDVTQRKTLDKDAGEISKEMNKDLTQAFQELSNVLNSLQKSQGLSVVASSVKDSIKESLEG